MNLVFKINEELATISVTATELLSVTKTITGLIRAPEFTQAFSAIIAEVNQSYGVVVDSFLPFFKLDAEEKFVQLFDDTYDTFKANYLMAVSKPRKYCDNVYDAYVEMQQMKEAKTTFPILKSSFARLNTLYDKWISNDSFLSMSIDGAIKMKQRLLTEIAETKIRDSEDAYLLFSSAFDDFRSYIDLIQSKSDSITQNISGK